jgi:S1-C subfamily serine protease
MKTLLCAALMFLVVGCINNNILVGLETDPSLLADYNVALHMEGYDGPICGATVVDDHTAITASHCVDAAVGYLIEPNNGELYPVTIKAVNAFETSDLAVLNIIGLPYQPTADVASSEPRFGDDIWVIGCGGGECDALSKGIVSKLGVKDHYGLTANQFDVTTWYGNSGGGVFDRYGRLVGVVSQFGPQFDRGYTGEPETGWMYACPVAAIREILSR